MLNKMSFLNDGMTNTFYNYLFANQEYFQDTQMLIAFLLNKNRSLWAWRCVYLSMGKNRFYFTLSSYLRDVLFKKEKMICSFITDLFKAKGLPELDEVLMLHDEVFQKNPFIYKRLMDEAVAKENGVFAPNVFNCLLVKDNSHEEIKRFVTYAGLVS
jgi:hypothetical protein